MSTAPLNNNQLFAQLLEKNPPAYNINDLVKTSSGIGYVSGRVFKENRESKISEWKYTIRMYGIGINFNIDVTNVICKL